MRTSESGFLTPYQPYSNLGEGRNISLFFGSVVYLDVSKNVFPQTHFNLSNVTVCTLHQKKMCIESCALWNENLQT